MSNSSTRYCNCFVSLRSSIQATRNVSPHRLCSLSLDITAIFMIYLSEPLEPDAKLIFVPLE